MKFIGDVESLLLDIDEEGYLMPYFAMVNQFLIEEESKERIEIYAKVQDAHHYFYVDRKDIAPV